MKPIRRVPTGVVFSKTLCCSCGDCHGYWDRIAGKTYCVTCVESLAVGELDPMVERTECGCCAACGVLGTLRYLTFPHRSSVPVEIDLCGEHLRALIARRLGPRAFKELCRQLSPLNLYADDIFLLNSMFYNHVGRALEPVVAQ